MKVPLPKPPGPLWAAQGNLNCHWYCFECFRHQLGVCTLVNPRRFFALAERGDLPGFCLGSSAKTGAPYASILLTAALVCGLTLTGSFAELAALSVVARFMQYIPTCLTVLVFRHRDGEQAREGYRVPMGPVIPLVAVGLCLWLLIEADPEKLLKGLIGLGIGAFCIFVLD